MNINNQQHKGFTLVETMVAISILMFAILGPLSIASSGLVNARIARDQVTAFYLAQEGLEFVRYARDTNFLRNQNNVSSANADGDNWLFGVNVCISANGCQIDVSRYFDNKNVSAGGLASVINSCGSGCDTPLSIDSTTGMYTYDSASGNRFSPFIRTIRIDRITNDKGGNNEIRVTSHVEWNTGVVTKEVELVENIRNIYDAE